MCGKRKNVRKSSHIQCLTLPERGFLACRVTYGLYLGEGQLFIYTYDANLTIPIKYNDFSLVFGRIMLHSELLSAVNS